MSDGLGPPAVAQAAQQSKYVRYAIIGLGGLLVLMVLVRRTNQPVVDAGGGDSTGGKPDTIYVPTTNSETIIYSNSNNSVTTITAPPSPAPSAPDGRSPIVPLPLPRQDKPAPLPRNPGPMKPIARCADGSLPDEGGWCVSPGGFPYRPGEWIPIEPPQSAVQASAAMRYELKQPALPDPLMPIRASKSVIV